MKIIKITFVAVALSLMTGCMSTGYGVGYQERAVQQKCQQSANRAAGNAYVKKESTVRFAENRQQAAKAQQQFQKRMESLQVSYNRCLNNGQKRIFEQNLRRQISYNF